MSRVQQRDGFVLLEQILALMVFAIVGVALVTALNEVGRLASQARKEAVLSRLLDSELRAAMSMPTLEEFEETISLEEMKVDMTTIVTPMEEMENEDGQLLQQMWLVRVEATWWQDNEWQERSAETWRYGRLYVP
jgi:type II secretory pathway pseudopilin PulG